MKIDNATKELLLQQEKIRNDALSQINLILQIYCNAKDLKGNFHVSPDFSEILEVPAEPDFSDVNEVSKISQIDNR